MVWLLCKKSQCCIWDLHINLIDNKLDFWAYFASNFIKKETLWIMVISIESKHRLLFIAYRRIKVYFRIVDFSGKYAFLSKWSSMSTVLEFGRTYSTVKSLASEANPSATQVFKRAYKMSYAPRLQVYQAALPCFAAFSKIQAGF